VGFARQWGKRLSTLTGDEGARRLLTASPEDIVCCEVDDPGILRDIDQRSDLGS